MFVVPYTTRTRHVVSPAFGRTLDRLFDATFDTRFDGRTQDAAPRTPAMDVAETDAAYTLAFDVPGVAREQLKVSIDGRRVSIETVAPPAAEAAPVAEGDAKPADAQPAAPRALYRERQAARYARTVSLPAEVDQAASQAKFDNGVLTLTLAKRVPTGAVQLNIA